MSVRGSKRQKITSALVEKLKEIDGTGDFSANLFNNVEAKIKFWDEVSDFPYVSVVAANETREYMPGEFEWGFLVVNVRVYVNQDDSQEALETVLADIENHIRNNREIMYDTEQGHETTDIQLLSIETDGGLLNPLGIGELVLLVQYQIV